MSYEFDIPMLIRRYVPTWFRRPTQLQLLVAWLRPVAIINARFAQLRTRIEAERRFNGLLHSLEWVLNDRFDPIERRIRIGVVDQLAVAYCQDEQDPPIAYLGDELDVTSYYCLDEEEGETYTHEFVVHVPAVLTFFPKDMFAILDVYRFAGRRPAIRLHDELDQTIELILP